MLAAFTITLLGVLIVVGIICGVVFIFGRGRWR